MGSQLELGRGLQLRSGGEQDVGVHCEGEGGRRGDGVGGQGAPRGRYAAVISGVPPPLSSPARPALAPLAACRPGRSRPPALLQTLPALLLIPFLTVSSATVSA